MHFDITKSTILLSLSGSRAYGIHNEDSDWDFKGVLIQPTWMRDSLFKTFEQAEGKEAILPLLELCEVPIDQCEGTVYELKKFMKLASDCNPNILDVLFSDDDDVFFLDDAGKELRANRHLFLSKKALYTFQGYAHAQLKRIETHRKWLLSPKEKMPERKDFGLKDSERIPTEMREELFSFVQSKIDSWQIDFGDLLDSEKIKIQNQIANFLEEILDGKDKIWNIAANDAISFLSDDLKEILRKEKKFKDAMNDWKKYQTWKSERNEKRAELERKFGFDTKHGAHLVRLLLSCQEIMETGTLHVRLKNADFIKSIRNGAFSYEKLMEWMKAKEIEIAKAAEKSSIQHRVDQEKIQELYDHLISIPNARS